MLVNLLHSEVGAGAEERDLEEAEPAVSKVSVAEPMPEERVHVDRVHVSGVGVLAESAGTSHCG